MTALPRRRFRGLLICGGIGIGLAAGGHLLFGHLEALLDLRQLVQGAMQDGPTRLAVLAIYVLVLACPFVPGAELGLLLLLVVGAEIAGAVYLATVAALVLAYLIGRLVPPQAVPGLGRRLDRPPPAGGAAGPADPDGARRYSRLATSVLGALLCYRCCALVVLINTPGNSLLGGGGGIAMAVGNSRLIPFRAFVPSVAVAVAPVPALLAAADWLAT